jgi:hypothetical protein
MIFVIKNITGGKYIVRSFIIYTTKLYLIFPQQLNQKDKAEGTWER